MKLILRHTSAVALAISLAGFMHHMAALPKSPRASRVEIANREASATLKKNGPLLCKDSVFDFGRVPAGDALHATFPITNTGPDAVWFRVVESCSCTHKSDYWIEPGETINIPVRMATSHARGGIRKSIRIKPISFWPPSAPPASVFDRLMLSTQQWMKRILARARCFIEAPR